MKKRQKKIKGLNEKNYQHEKGSKRTKKKKNEKMIQKKWRAKK